MSNFIVPNTFIPGTKAKAQEVNENFTSIQNELNTKATKTGDVTQPFFVAPAIEDNQATTKKQIEKIIEDTKSNLFSEIEKNDLCLFALNGNVNEDGKSYLIDFSGMSLSFLVGGSYPNLLGNIQGTSVEITSVEAFSLSGYVDGTYNIFVNKDGEITALVNKIYIQPKEPTMVINDIWVDTSVYPNKIKQFNGTEKVLFEKIFIGKVIIKDSQIESVSTNPYKSKMVTVVNHTNSAQVIETYQNGSSWYRIYSDGWCEQGGNVLVNATLTLTFLKPFKDTNYKFFVQSTYKGGNTIVMVMNNTKSISSIQISPGYYSSGNSDWVACGYLADGQY